METVAFLDKKPLMLNEDITEESLPNRIKHLPASHILLTTSRIMYIASASNSSRWVISHSLYFSFIIIFYLFRYIINNSIFILHQNFTLIWFICNLYRLNLLQNCYIISYYISISLKSE